MRTKTIVLLTAAITCSAMSQGLPDIERYFGGHNNSIFGIAYSNDATRIATTQVSGPVNIFNAATGELVRVLPLGGTQVTFTPNDEKLIVGGAFGFTVFDTATGSKLHQLSIPNPITTTLRAGAVSQNGAFAAAVISDFTAIVWDLNSGESKHLFATPGVTATSAAFMPSGNLAVGNTAGQVVVYDPNDGSVVQTISAHNGSINTLEVRGNVMLSGGADGRLKTWDAESGALIRQFQGHTGQVYVARISPTGQHLISGGSNGQFFLWNANGGVICAFWNHQGAVRGAAFSPNGTEVVGGDQMMNVNHWRIAGLILLRNLSVHKGEVDEVAVSSDGRTSVSAGSDGKAKVWRDGLLYRTINFGPQIYSADIAPDGEYLALGGGVMTFIYDIDTGAQVGSTFHGGVSMGARFSRDSQSVFSSCTGHELKRVALNGNQSWLIHLDGPVLYVAVPPKGNYIAAATLHENASTVYTRISIVNSGNGQVLRSWDAHPDYIRGLEFAQNGDLVTAFFDGTIQSWNPETGGSRWSRTTPGGIESIALNRSGDVIMTGEHGILRMFNVSNGAQIRMYDEQIPNAVNSVKFSPDERWFIYGLDTGTFAIARSPFDASVELAQLVRGSTVSGGAASLNERDGIYWRIRPGAVLSTSMPPVELVLTGTSPSATASRLSFSATLGASATALAQKVELYDYQLNAWELVDSRAASVTGEVVTIDLSNATRFVSPLTRQIRARLTWKQTGPVLGYPWQSRIDQAYWTIVP